MGTEEAKAAAQRVRSGLSDELYNDLSDWDTFFLTKRSETATKVATTTNNTYIKVTGDERGVDAYADVYQLLVCWHLDQVVRPSQVVEITKFDPFDESQVDLRGYVNSPVEETEPAEE